MTVYVDNFGVPASVFDDATGRTYRGRWSHLTADTQDELHAFAARVGLQRRWFQTCKTSCGRGECVHWHYDVTATRRTQAIAAGAQAIDIRQMAGIIRARRDALKEN